MNQTNTQEIEVKIIDISRAKIEQKLIDLGAIKTFEGELIANIYDTIDSFIYNNKNAFRLRKQGDKNTVLTFKKYIKNTHAKQRQEFEVEVSDFDTMAAILEELRFIVKQVTHKTRTTYTLGNIHFEFDKYLGEHNYVPEFLEIESPDIQTLDKYVQALGFTKADCKNWDPQQLFDHYRKS